MPPDPGTNEYSISDPMKQVAARYWEDFPIGASYLSEKQRIAEDEIYHFASLSGDFMPLSLDEEFARQSIYGQRIVQGMFVLSKIVGLSHEMGGSSETSLGILEMNWKFDQPLFIGDDYAVEVIIENKQEIGRQDAGLLHQSMIVRNSTGEIVQQGQIVQLIRRRTSEQFGRGRTEG